MQVPIIAPVKQKKLEVNEQASLPTFYSSEFLAGLMTNPELVRNVAVIGHLHHGKSLVRFFFKVMDLLWVSCKISICHTCK